MTENTQTTQERLLAIIGMNYAIIQHGDIRIADHSKAAQIIADEIDTLTAQRDEARTEIDALTAQLAEAKPKADAWDARDAYIREPGDDDRLYEDWESAEFNIIMAQKNAQLTAALAEVERLRPMAEAFEWWENYASNPSTTTWDIFQTAAQRARDLSFVESRAVILDDYQIDTLKRGVTRARAAKERKP